MTKFEFISKPLVTKKTAGLDPDIRRAINQMLWTEGDGNALQIRADDQKDQETKRKQAQNFCSRVNKKYDRRVLSVYPRQKNGRPVVIIVKNEPTAFDDITII